MSQRNPIGVGTECSLGFSPGGSGDRKWLQEGMWLLERGKGFNWV